MTKKGKKTTFVWIYVHRKDESVAGKPAEFTIKTRGFNMLSWPLDILREDTFDLVYIFVFLSKISRLNSKKVSKIPPFPKEDNYFAYRKR